MPVSAVLSAWIALAVVLALSGVGKLRHPGGAVEAITSLRVPPALRRPWLIRAHPWVELALAALLLVLPHPWSVIAAAATLVLLLGYLLLVGRAVAAGDEATCHCFGSVGSGAVNGWTVARNVLLALVGGVVLVDAALGQAAISRLMHLGEAATASGGGRAAAGDSGWWWVLALVLAVALTVLVVRPDQRATDPFGDTPAHPPVLRLPVPDALVRSAPDAEAVSLRGLTAGRPRVLLLLSPGCGPCRMISGQLADWQRALPGTGLLVVHAVSFTAVRKSLPEWEPFFVQDTEGAVARAFGDPARPWAVLLGADGRIDSPPAQGYTAITALVEQLRQSHSATKPSRTGPAHPRPAPDRARAR